MPSVKAGGFPWVQVSEFCQYLFWRYDERIEMIYGQLHSFGIVSGIVDVSSTVNVVAKNSFKASALSDAVTANNPFLPFREGIKCVILQSI